MDLVRVHVTPLGLGYMAESRIPDITAMGTTAEEAAENARRQAVQMLHAGESDNGMLIVRVSDAGRESIAMQSLLSRFTFRSAQMNAR